MYCPETMMMACSLLPYICIYVVDSSLPQRLVNRDQFDERVVNEYNIIVPRAAPTGLTGNPLFSAII